jgi:RNAse (barnase) inhibitor barstar
VSVTWVFESSVFADGQAALKGAAAAAGHRCVEWQDDWWADRGWPALGGDAVVFHGSLGNAARIERDLPWAPAGSCGEAAFRCSAWYPRALRWLTSSPHEILPANELVADPEWVFEQLGNPASIFVRPDSPLKPFSGRVLPRDGVTLAALDHGFYYDDPALPVVVAPARSIGREWRFVVADARVVAGSRYSAEERRAHPEPPEGAAWDFAARVASVLAPPAEVYVMDVCECDGELRILELNPFGGADLYACRAEDVVAAVSAVAARTSAAPRGAPPSPEPTVPSSPRPIRELDGRRFSTLDGFWDEIDRVLLLDSVWGRNLDAFNDVLGGGFGTPEGGYELVWSHHELSKERLGHAETIRLCEKALADGTTHPSGRRHIEHELRLARAGLGPTTFDELVSLILEHDPSAGGNVVLVLR